MSDTSSRLAPGASRSKARLDHPLFKGLLLAALWMIPPLLMTATAFSGEPRTPLSWPAFLGFQLLYWQPWALLTPLFLGLARRFPWALSWRGARHVGLHLVASAGVAAFYTVYSVVVELAAVDPPRLTLSSVTEIALHLGGPTFSTGILIGWILLAAGSMLAAWQRAREREALLTEARLRALKAQVHPHFLFNTLHAVSTLMAEDVPAARRMLAGLAELLRESLRGDADHLVPLSEEIALAKLYLDIEQARFADRLEIDIAIEPAARNALVPHLLLQPLVENAVRHGIARRAAAGSLKISAQRDGGNLVIEVDDDGPGLDTPPHHAAPGHGLGLSNVRARLAELYGEAAHLDLRSRRPHGCKARLKLPLERAAEPPLSEAVLNSPEPITS